MNPKRGVCSYIKDVDEIAKYVRTNRRRHAPVERSFSVLVNARSNLRVRFFEEQSGRHTRPRVAHP